MFLGLTNSADDIIRDRAVLQRERNLNVRLSYYVFAKTVSLGVFALVSMHSLRPDRQLPSRDSRDVLDSISAIVLHDGDGRSCRWAWSISSLVADPKTAANIVPLVLIPQIIMGGALIKYEDMNRNLALVYTFTRWFHEHPNSDETQENGQPVCRSRSSVEFVAMRWSYEELVVAQAKLNPLTRRQDEASEQIDRDRRPARVQIRRSETARRLEGDARRSFRSRKRTPARAGSNISAMIDRILNGKIAFRSCRRSRTRTVPITGGTIFT